MAPELIAEDGNERQHRPSLQKMLRATQSLVRIASAYVTDRDLLLVSKERRVRLLTSLVRMDIVSGATSLAALRSLVQAGVECRSFSGGARLHAKVYIFGDECAIVTSANLTTSALDSNIEVGVQLTGAPVKQLSNWFDAFWGKASQVGLRALSDWEEETANLRRAFAALRRKAGDKPRRGTESIPQVRSQAEFRNLMRRSPRFFICNTNRLHSPDGRDEALMRRSRYAAVWTDFKFPTHMQRVEEGDAIFMFAKRVGIVGVGRAKGATQILPPGDPDRLTNEFEYDAEWRVPVDDWLVWVEDDADAFLWKMPNASFVDASGDDYREMRQAVCRHFLREPL